MAAAPSTEKQQDTRVRVGAYAGNRTREVPLRAAMPLSGQASLLFLQTVWVTVEGCVMI